MSALLPRLAAASVGTAVALSVLAAPTAALAAPGNGPSPSPAAASPSSKAPAGSAGGAAAGRSAAHAGAAQQAAPAGAKAGAKAGATAPRRSADTGTARRDGRATADAAQERAGAKAKPRPARPEQGRPAAKPERGKGKGASQAERGEKKAAPAAPRTTAADPRGNNGTFKVDGPVLDTSHGNEPHVACAFRLNFFGYDAGQLASISFTAIAPTPGATTTVDGLQLVSTSAARGGLYGGSYPATGTWSAADLGLDPTVRQHVKVSVESLNADGSDVPGGAKSKVFWLEPCAAAAPASITTASVPFVGPVAAPTEIAGTAVTEAATAPAAAVAPEQPASTVSARSAAPATVVALPAQAAGQPFFLPHGTPRSASTPTTLPFTGSAPLLVLLVGGLVSLLAGVGLVAAARRSA